jgi:hypothetical protein
VNDFVIIEYNGEIGGRVKHTNFGKDPNGNPYTIELGANWYATQLTFRMLLMSLLGFKAFKAKVDHQIPSGHW